ncbi:unnamed protein product, partial [Ectocarpus fasciculatus]
NNVHKQFEHWTENGRQEFASALLLLPETPDTAGTSHAHSHGSLSQRRQQHSGIQWEARATRSSSQREQERLRRRWRGYAVSPPSSERCSTSSSAQPQAPGAAGGRGDMRGNSRGRLDGFRLLGATAVTGNGCQEPARLHVIATVAAVTPLRRPRPRRTRRAPTGRREEGGGRFGGGLSSGGDV